MPLGDGIRRNVATISKEERIRFRDAIIKLNGSYYLGERKDNPVGGVSYWFKQAEIHEATGVHRDRMNWGLESAGFIPWCREFCNRFETLLRWKDHDLSLHYWDWTTDPRDLFTSDFMGSYDGPVGEPWLSARFYDPAAEPYRDEKLHTDRHELHANPFDPPRILERSLKSPGKPDPSKVYSDHYIFTRGTYTELRVQLEVSHDNAEQYIGGTMCKSDNPQFRTTFRDPFAFLLHSNMDRLFAMWQLQPGKTWRLDPNLIYGEESNSATTFEFDSTQFGIKTPLEPWAGISAPGAEKGVIAVRPWAPPENEMVLKNSKDISIVRPPLYDTTLPLIRPTLYKFTGAKFEKIEKFEVKEMIEKMYVKVEKFEKSEKFEAKEADRIPIDLVPKTPDPESNRLLTERLNRFEERLATMESFIRPEERPQLGEKKTHKRTKKSDDQTLEE